MSNQVSSVPANNEVNAVSFKFKSLQWRVCWRRMQAIDDKGRLWLIRQDGEELILVFEQGLQATITCADVRASFTKHRGVFLNKWVGRSLIE